MNGNEPLPPEVGVLARRLRRMRDEHGWGVRELAAKSGVSASTANRGERGHDIYLSSAIRLAAALGSSLSEAIAAPDCATCDGYPPAGFTCGTCGRGTPAVTA